MRILVIDNDRALCRSLQIHLEELGHAVESVHTGKAGLLALHEAPPELVFIDLKLPDMSGMDCLREVRAMPDPPLAIMITGMQQAQATIEAIRLGAFDYIRKPLDLETLSAAFEKIKQHQARAAVPVKASPPEEPVQPLEFVGAHPTVIDVLKQIAVLSKNRIPVLILGESGTGKELVARLLHEADAGGRPFVGVNCSAIVPTLLESELFGHEKGAFTGADAAAKGKLEYAGDGTVFLDEIGDMTRDLQAKLLRVIQEREFYRVGSPQPLPFHARVIAATNRDLKTMVEARQFREDLYYRLSVATLYLPPLRARRSDIAMLAEHLLKQISAQLHKDLHSLERRALDRLQNYDWPGNVRELQNVLTRAVLLAQGSVLTLEDLDAAMGPERPGATTSAPGRIKTLRELELEHIERTLDATGWNLTRAAELLDVTRVTLRKRINDYGLAASDKARTPLPGRPRARTE